MLELVYERTALKVKEQFKHVPEELRLKEVALIRAETRVHNFVEFVASGRATPALADALAQAEEQNEITARRHRKPRVRQGRPLHAAAPAWIVDRVQKRNQLLAQRTEVSAVALRRLTGPGTRTAESPEVGPP